jgi:hypothetical protein
LLDAALGLKHRNEVIRDAVSSKRTITKAELDSFKGPKLRFGIKLAEMTMVFNVTIEISDMSGANGRYVIDGGINDSPVTLTFGLDKDATGCRGILEDRL